MTDIAPAGRATSARAARAGLGRQSAVGALIVVGLLVIVTAVVVISPTARPQAHAGASQTALRDGWDADEPALSPAHVADGSFQQLFAAQLNGSVQGQPVIAGSTLVAATENDWVYGLDPATGAVRWSRSLGKPVANQGVICAVLGPNSGITSTPVYDPGTGLVYLVAEIAGTAGNQPPSFLMYALDAQSGAVAWTRPIEGSPANDPSTSFEPSGQLQRPALLLLDGWVYAAFGPRCEGTLDYRGYVAGVEATTRKLVMWTDEAGSVNGQAGIWQGGSGLMSDGTGRIFLASGDGLAPAPGSGSSPRGQLGESVVRLSVGAGGQLSAADFYAPADSATLNTYDLDVGADGPVGLPFGTAKHPHLVAVTGKNGPVLLLDRDDLGGTGAQQATSIVAQAGPFPQMIGRPAAFAGGSGADYLYYAGDNDHLHALRLTTDASGNASLSDVAQSTDTYGSNSGSPVVTSNGSDPTSAVVWEVNLQGNNGVLEAYTAVPQQVGKVLQLKQIWSAAIGFNTHFSMPTTGNGRVYVGNRLGQVLGFGTVEAPVLSAAGADLGQVGVGTSVSRDVVLTATTQVTLASLSAANLNGDGSAFSVGTAQQAGEAISLPATLKKGQRVTIPVTFRPDLTGGALGSIDVSTTSDSQPLVSVPLAGDGIRPGLTASATSVPFLNSFPGMARRTIIEITNTGLTPQALGPVKAPAAPFGLKGLPASDTVLQPGQTITAQVTYSPTKVGHDASSLSITPSQGPPIFIDLSGTAIKGDAGLTVKPAALHFGRVRIGQSRSLTFDVIDPGVQALTVLQPIRLGAGLTLSPAMPAGESFGPGDGLRLTVTFTPRAAGRVSTSIRIPFVPLGTSRTRSLRIPVTADGLAAN